MLTGLNIRNYWELASSTEALAKVEGFLLRKSSFAEAAEGNSLRRTKGDWELASSTEALAKVEGFLLRKSSFAEAAEGNSLQRTKGDWELETRSERSDNADMAQRHRQ